MTDYTQELRLFIEQSAREGHKDYTTLQPYEQGELANILMKSNEDEFYLDALSHDSCYKLIHKSLNDTTDKEQGESLKLFLGAFIANYLERNADYLQGLFEEAREKVTSEKYHTIKESNPRPYFSGELADYQDYQSEVISAVFKI